MAKRQTRAEKATNSLDKKTSATCARAAQVWPALAWRAHPWRRRGYVAAAMVGGCRVVLINLSGAPSLAVTLGGDDSEVIASVLARDLLSIALRAPGELKAAGAPEAVVRALAVRP